MKNITATSFESPITYSVVNTWKVSQFEMDIYYYVLKNTNDCNKSKFFHFLLSIFFQIGHYSSEKYDGTFVDFLEDESISDQDPGIRSGYGTSMLLVETLNAK